MVNEEGKVTSAKLEQLLKAYIPIFDVPSGMLIFVREVLFSNAYSPIILNDDGKVASFKSNFVQPLKVHLPILSTPSGIVTLVSFLLFKKADLAIAITFLPANGL